MTAPYKLCMSSLSYVRSWVIRRTSKNSYKPEINHFGVASPSLFYPTDKWSQDSIDISSENSKVLLSLAKTAYRKQKFDLSLWRRISEKFEVTHRTLSPQHLVSLLHCFKQIKCPSFDTFNKCIEQLQGNVHKLDLYYLSLLSLTFKYNNPPYWLLIDISAQTRLKLESLAVDTMSTLENIKFFESLTHILGSFSHIKYSDNALFQLSAEALISLINKLELVPGHYIHKLIMSYSRLNYNHTRLFDLLSEQILSSKLSNKELLDIKTAFDSVSYHNPKVFRFVTYRNVISTTK